jgi:tetratricopeptide (TPR) repeat protein
VRHDRFGLPVSTGVPDVVDGIDTFANEVLGHGKGAAVILDAAALDPEATLPNAYCAALYLFLQTAEGTLRAAPWLERARRAALSTHATERERTWVAALDAWARGAAETALARHLEIARSWPRDLLNIKFAQIHQLNLGDRQGMRELADAILPAHRDASYAWGLLAFALEQVGELDAAQAAGEHAVAMNRDDPWAQHAVAHVFEARGDARQGMAWLEGLSETWERCSSFMYTHNWWHLALFHLERDEAEQALALYDRRIWGVRKTYVQDQINAVSLLARLELAGVDVGHRWADVAGHVRPRIFDRQNAFLDLHFGYALARAGEDIAVAKLVGGIADHAAQSAAPVWREIALPAVHGMVAYARGQLREAAARLGPLAGRMHLLGGSTAQQDWFEQMRRDALSHARPCGHAVGALAGQAA